MPLLKIKLLLVTFILSMNSFAGVPTEIKKFIDKDGVSISLIDGEKIPDEDGTNCRVTISPYGDDDSIVINSVAYFTPVAHLEGAKRTVKGDTVIFTLNDSGKRPGGSVGCGNVPQLSYKKTVEVKGSTLLIKQKFHCLFEGSTEIITGCKLR